ncbi:hypothetical protein ACU6W1_02265 [Weissella cibaria]
MAEDLEKQTRQRLRDEEVLDRDRQKNRDEIARLQSNQAAVDNDEVPVEKISEKNPSHCRRSAGETQKSAESEIPSHSGWCPSMAG